MKKNTTKLINPTTANQKGSSHGGAVSITAAPSAATSQQQLAATMPPPHGIQQSSQQQGTNDGALALPRRSQAQIFAAQQQELSRQFGVVCAETITWKLWNVGGEYERRLIIKNTHDKLQVISYKLPKHKAVFFVDFPEPVSLSSGMSHSLSIRFRPSELVECNDEMEICVRGRGSFFVHLQALTPYAHLTTPDKYDFELCPVNVPTSYTFPVKNSGTVPLSVTWEVPEPFSIEPRRIALEEGEQTNVTVTFLPRDAKPVIAQAVCRIDESGDVIAFVRFSGISRFGFLQAKEDGVLVGGGGGGGTNTTKKAITSANSTTRGATMMANNTAIPMQCSGTGRDITLDFGPMLTTTRTTRYITIVNPSDVDADFQIKRLDKDITSAFFISPLAATVPRRGGEVRVSIRFEPKNTGAHYSSSYILDSICCSSLIKFQCSGEAIGPTVSLSATSIDFGDVDVDAICGDDLIRAANPLAAQTPITIEKHVSLRNTSSVPLKFEFAGAIPGGAFVVSPPNGSINAKTSMNIKITFAPDAPVNYLRRMYLLTSFGDSALILDVFGTAFTAKTRPAPFNARGVQLYFLKAERGLGSLPPDELERLVGMLREGVDPTNEKDESAMEALADVLSSASPVTSPRLVSSETPRYTTGTTSKSHSNHTSKAAKKRAQLSTVFPGDRSQSIYPFVLDTPLVTIRHETLRDPQVVVVRNTTSSKATASWSLPVESRVHAYSILQAAKDSSTANHSKSGKKSGASSPLGSPRGGPPTANTAGQLNPANMDSFWRITPTTADIPPHGTATFQVSLDPNAPPASFGCFLECFVTYKTMRSFRLVTDDSFVPSQCLLLQCTHLAPFRENGPTPHVQLPTAVAFPPCEEKKAVYQVVDLHNNGNTAQAYDIHIEATMLRDSTGGSPNALYPDMASASMYKSINYDNDVSGGGGGGTDDDSRQMTLDDIALSEERKKMLSGVFTSYPSSGIIPPGGSALVLVKFSPPLRSQFLGAAHIAFNGSNVPSSNIVLKGESFVPSVSLQSGSRLTFRPTTIGATCTREYVITNRSRIAVDYEIAVPEEFAGIFHVSSTHGTIQGCQELRLQASFTPQAEMKYQTSIPVHITSAADFVTAAAPTSLKITALGAGEVGLLSMEPLSVKVPSVSVGSFVQRTLTIFNTGLSDTAFQLRCISKRASQQSQLPGGADLGALQLTNNGNTSGLNEDQQDAVVMMPDVQFGPSSSGIVRARAHLNVSVRIKLPTRGTFQLSIYALSHGSLELLESAPTPTQQEMRRLPMSVFTMTGEHPALQVADVRCIHQQKSQLWTQMNVGSFNAKLREPVDEVDRRIRPMLFDDAINELSGIECHLGTDIFHAAPLRILIALKNDGNSSVKYDFRLPLDNEIAKEPWHADKRGLDDPIADVVDKGLFDIQPRCGLIPPFGQAVVTLQYCHSEIGTHAIPAILRVNDGKQVLMNMTATTNSPVAKMLTFHHGMRHELLPVAIGDLDPPLQYTEVQNLSSVPINFTIDEQAFANLKEANYDFPILQCLNHSGSIPPMSTLLLSWYFRPLEAKQYEVPLTVTVEGGDSYSITLIGSGYHPKLLSKDALIKMNTTGFSDIPAVPSLEHLTLPMRLSMDVIRYGTIAFHTLHRRHVQLSNTHPTDIFLFEWHCVLQHGDQVFEVEPPSGQLLPGETIHFRVSLYAGSTSHILDTAVHCHVINESLRLRRQAITAKKEHAAALNLNNKHQQMSSDLLSLTGGSGAGGAGGAKAPRGTRPRMPITTVPPKYQSMKRLQRTVQALEDAAIAEDMDEGADEWAHVPVVPTVVELIVQARIMPIDAYTDLFGEEAAASMFYPTLLGTKYPGDIFPVSSLGPVRTPTPLVGNSTANERQVAEGCLKEMLKRVVQHVSVQEALLDPREDPVPYFCEAIATSIMGDDKDVDQMRAESALCDMVIDERDAPTSTGLPPRQPQTSSLLSEEEEELRTKSATIANNNNNTHPIGEHVNGSDEDEGVDDAVVFSRVTKRAVEPVPGDIQCIVEEVLEDVLFGLVASALAAEGVVVSAAEERKRAQSLRRDTLY